MADPTTILIVDDEENIRWSFERALTHEGFRVLTAPDVRTARALLADANVRVLLTDLDLPGESGLLLSRWAREHRPDVRIILTSAYPPPAASAGGPGGSVELLEKPVDIAELARRLLRADAGERSPAAPLAGDAGSGPEAPRDVDTTKAVEIAQDVYWVGHRNPRTLLQCNVYLRVFRRGDERLHLLVDPGSPIDLPVMSKKVGSVIGDLGKIDLFSVNHQDPDVVANAVVVQRMNPRAECIASEDTWRLIAHYDLDPSRVRLVESFPDRRMTLSTGHVVQFVPTPFCHFRGAVALYDLDSRVLFTGDLFGGLSTARHARLYATDASWDGMKAFHRIYMPSRKVLDRAVRTIRALRPRPLVIAPQHGDLLVGPRIDEYLARIADLRVGADLFDDELDLTMEQSWREVASDLVRRAVELLGEKAVAEKLAAPGARPELASYLAGRGGGGAHAAPATSELLSELEEVLSRDEGYETASELRMAAIKAAVDRDLPIRTGKLEGDGEAGPASPGTW